MIYKIELNFPIGVTMDECQKIAMIAEKITGYRITQGGHKMLTSIHAETISFDENVADFVFSNAQYWKKKND